MVRFEMSDQQRQQASDYAGRQVVAHAVDAGQLRGWNAACHIFAAGERHQRVGAAMHDKGRHRHFGKLFGAPRVGDDGDHLPHEAGRVVTAGGGRDHARAQIMGLDRVAGAADEGKKFDGMVDFGVERLVSGPAKQRTRDFGAGRGQAARAAGAHHTGQAVHPGRRGERHALGNHAAHADTHHMRLVNMQGVQHAYGVVGHVLQRVGRPRTETQPVFHTFPHQIRRPELVEVLAEADVAVVEVHHPKTGIHQALHHRRRPRDQLHAQAHDEQNHGTAGSLAWACGAVLDFKLNSVCYYFHSSFRTI